MSTVGAWTLILQLDVLVLLRLSRFESWSLWLAARFVGRGGCDVGVPEPNHVFFEDAVARPRTAGTDRVPRADFATFDAVDDGGVRSLR
jgi:hypothetical protein